MDSLSHLMLAFGGGLLFVLWSKAKIRHYEVAAFAIASTFIDVDHLLPHYGLANTLLLHNLVVAALLSVVTALLFGRARGALASVMLAGHLLFDMVSGLYGIPLLYPLSETTYLIPEAWELWLFGDPSYTVASRTGIALSAYAAVVAAAKAALRPKP